MSKVIFVKCSVEGCEFRSYPVEEKDLELLTKCPNCDPDAHSLIRKAKQQANMISNKAKSQGKTLDAGKVQSLDDGAAALKAAGVNLEDGADGLGVEVEHTPETPVVPASVGGLKIPKITVAQAKAQAKKGKGKGKK